MTSRVEMTKGRVVMVRNGGQGKNRPQISPLRFAPVEMTKGRVVMARNGGQGKNRPQISPLHRAPVEMTKNTVYNPQRNITGREHHEKSIVISTPNLGHSTRAKRRPMGRLRWRMEPRLP